jgi:DNA-binding NarL/FixJ family response regulator
MKNRKFNATKTAPRKIFIIDDHPLTRRGVVQLVEHEADLTIYGEAENGRVALAALKPPLPDLILCDLTMPDKNGLELLKDLHAQHPEVPVLVVSMHDENIYAERALRAGARGYIMKSEGAEKILDAIRQVLQGEVYVSKSISGQLLNLLTGGHARRKDTKLSALTDREFEVFEAVGQGLSTFEIGRRLHISGKTVETHRIHIKEKLKFQSAAEFNAYAVRWAAANHMI